MTTQGAYEQIREYFSRFGAELATNPDGSCQYKTEHGHKCAVGCLIPEDEYEPTMEGMSFVSSWLNEFPFLKGLFYGVDKKFLAAAQVLHDRVAKNPEAFCEGLDLLASLFGLTPVISSPIWRSEFLKPA